MSTRATIKLVGDWHLYRELSDDLWHTWLEFPKEALEATEHGFALRIPSAVWKALREGEARSERYLDMSPEELRREAEEWVTRRLKDYAEAPESHKPLIALSGMLIANIDDPTDKQVADYIAAYTPPEEQTFLAQG